jgi:hypothetical protein
MSELKQAKRQPKCVALLDDAARAADGVKMSGAVPRTQCKRIAGRKVADPKSTGTKLQNSQEMELIRLRAELSDVKRELRYIKQATAHFVRILL